MPIFGRKDCIVTASGIVALCGRLCGVPVENRLKSSLLSTLQSALNRHAVQPFAGSGDAGCCDNEVCPPEDGHVNARNMSRIIV
jgi:hypothetical protein